MSLQGYIFENKNYLKIKKRNCLNYNDIYLLFTKIIHDILVMFFFKIYSNRNVLEIICCYKSYLY